MDIQQRRPGRGGEQPFDQRFLLFAITAMAILMLFNSFFAPPPVAEGEAKLADNGAPAAPAADPAVGAPPAAPATDGEEAPIEEEPAASPQRVAIGAVGDDSPYRMLLTANNVGGAVERIELASDDYRDLDERSGYLGRLALSDAPGGGALVNVVGPGTPAAEAGLEAGDVVRAATILGKQGEATPAETPITTAEGLERLIGGARPFREARLKVDREGEQLELTAQLRRPPLNLLRPEIENIALHAIEPPEDFESAPSFVVRLASVGARRADDPLVAAANNRLADEAWTVDEQSADSVSFRKRLADLGVEFVKRFTVVETPEAERDNGAHPTYHFGLTVEVRNLRSEPQAIAYELTGPNGLPLEGYWYSNKIGRGDGSFFGDWGAFGLRDVVVRYAGDRFVQFSATQVAKDKVRPMGQGKPLAFVGVDSQYFASIVIPQKASLDEVRLAEVRAELATAELPETDPDRWENASCVLLRETATLAAAGQPGAELVDDYRVFAGPKLPELLDAYRVNDDPGHTLHSVLYYGWFGWAAKPMLWLLHTFNSLVGNYGLAIIMLTVCVRGAMFPIGRQQAMNMVKMQELKPEMDRIAERYKDDMQKRSQAQQELFRKHNYNPAAGCLPLFLQLPIFMGLYRALAVDVELRQAPLFTDAIRFCSNLAAPDMLYDWSGWMPHWVNTGQGLLGLGPYLNILPLATCGLFLLQQKMFMPPPANEQAALQQKMMQYMMIFMGLLFFKVPSGLCIYFIASSLWGIAERKMLPKPEPANTPAVTESAPPKPNPNARTSSNGAGEAARRKAKRKKSGGKKRK